MGKKGNRGVRIKQVGPKVPSMPMNPMDAFQIPPEDMIHLPPQPDRKYQVIWPITETFSMDFSGFQTIHPSYFDSEKTTKQGRRLSVAKSVPKPTVMDISQSLQALQIRHVVQPYKGYSRDITCQWDNSGRILFDSDRMRQLSYSNKRLLLADLAKSIVQLPSRIERLKREEEQRIRDEEEKKKALEMEATSAKQKAKHSRPTSTSASAKKAGTSNKKKGKGKKKR